MLWKLYFESLFRLLRIARITWRSVARMHEETDRPYRGVGIYFRAVMPLFSATRCKEWVFHLSMN